MYQEHAVGDLRSGAVVDRAVPMAVWRQGASGAGVAARPAWSRCPCARRARTRRRPAGGERDAAAEHRASRLQRRALSRGVHRVVARPDLRGFRADHFRQRFDRRHGRHLPRYAEQDSRVRYVRQPRNIGLSPNHNFVFAQSRGELFKWAAADDLYGRDLLQRCVEALDEHPDVVLAHAWEAAIDESGTVTQALEYPLATDSPSAPQRFRSFLFGSSGLFDSPDGDDRGLVRLDNRGILRACDEYGVIRSAVLRQISPLGSYHHSDRIVVCELALARPVPHHPGLAVLPARVSRSGLQHVPIGACPLRHLGPGAGEPAAAPDRPPARRVLLGIHRGHPASPALRSGPSRVLPADGALALDRAACRVVPKRMEPIDGQFSSLLHGREVSVRAVVAGQEEVTP